MNIQESKLKLEKFHKRIILLILIFLIVIARFYFSTIHEILGFLIYSLIILILILAINSIPFIGLITSLRLNINNLNNILLNDLSLTQNNLITWWFKLSIFISFLVQIFVDYKIISFIFYILGFGKYNIRTLSKFKNYALINCNIIDGKKNSDIIYNGIILVENIYSKNESKSEKFVDENNSFNIDSNFIGIIKAVGIKDNVKIPESYKIIDLKNKFVLPGLINAHAHLIGSGKPSGIFKLKPEFIEKIIFLLESKIVQSIIFKLMKKNVRISLNAGITTIRCLGDAKFLDVKLRNKINQNKILGPRLLVAGETICTTGGHGSLYGNVADSKTEFKKHVRNNISKGVDLIKIISTGGVMDAQKVSDAGKPQMTIDEIEVVTSEAHRANLKVAAHCESTKGIEEALIAGVDTIEHGAPLNSKIIELFKNNPKSLNGYSVLIPTIMTGMPLALLMPRITKITPNSYESAKIVFNGSLEGLKMAYKSGIKLGIGNDASVPFNTHYNIWKEIKYFSKFTGIKSQEAIYIATLGNAEILGIDKITGSIELNKSADMIVLDYNPLEDIESLSKIRFVIIKGMIIKNPKLKKIKKVEKLSKYIDI